MAPLKRLNDQLTIAAISALILLAAWLSSANSEGVKLSGIAIPPLCGFKLLTTWDCPGCGLTRSLVLALHGNWRASYLMHIWGIPLMILLLFQVPYRLFRYFKQKPVFANLSPDIKKWVSPAIFLSILLPWTIKTIAWAIISYL
jgi:hypothetical protein